MGPKAARTLSQGLIRQEGTGRHKSPFRYWPPDHEDRCPKNPPSLLEPQQLADRARLEQL
jgi:hypothetical protein